MQESQTTTNYDGSAVSDDVSLLQFWEIIRRRWLIILAVTISVLVLGIANYMRKPAIYDSSAKLLVNTEAPSRAIASATGLLSDVVALTAGRDLDTQIELLKSRDTINAAFSKLSAEDKEKGFESNSSPSWATSISKGNEYSSVITVTARSFDPEVAKKYAAILVDTYLERGKDINSKATKQAKEKVELEMNNAADNLEKAANRLAEYQASQNLAGKDAQATHIMDSLISLQQDLKTSKVELASIEAETAARNKHLAQLDPRIKQSETITRNPDFDRLYNELRDLNIEKTTKSVDYRPDSREITKLNANISAIEDEIKNVSNRLVSSETSILNPQRETAMTNYSSSIAKLSAQKAKIAALESVINDFQSQIDRMPEKMKNMASLARTVTNLENTFNQLSTEYYSLMIREQSTVPNALMFDSPKVPGGPSEPNFTKDLVLSLFMGVILGLLLGLIIDKLDTKIHSIKTGEEESDLSTLGAIPLVPVNAAGHVEIFSDESGMRGFWESIKIMRNNILYSITGDKSVIAITSPGPSAGKSLISSCLAHVLGLDGKNVCLIDCDLRKPNVHKVWGISRDIGFTNVVKNTISLDDALIKPEESSVSILTTGHLPPNPSEFLNSQQTLDLISRLREQFDYVIVDTPPTAGFSDVQVISRWVDSIVMVVALNQTIKPELNAAVRNIRQAGNNIIGAVYNKINTTNSDYYYYYYYYSNYNEDGSEQKVEKRRRRR